MVYGQILHRHGIEDDFINLNVGGFKQKVYHGTLLHFPQTRLGRLLHCHTEEAVLELCDDYCAADREYYFDRNPLSSAVSSTSTKQERKEYLEDQDWDMSDEQQLSMDSSLEEHSARDKDLERFEGTWCSEVRRHVWLTMEDPGYSRYSRAVTIASLAEFSIRLAVAPCPRKFLASPMNIIDFASILPFYITLAFETVDVEKEDLENVGKVVQILRLMRIFRILKLARHSVGLRALGSTLRHSYHEVGLLVLFLSVGISIFSVLIYFMEKEEDGSKLKTIPVGWWWATISMTTVGYGDICPVSLAGKVVATLCIISGLLVVALPITIVFNRFSKYYQRNKAMDVDLCSSEMESPEPDLLYFSIGDIYVPKMHSFIEDASPRNSKDKTDASHITDMETASGGGAW
ncbi:hypothetical protein SKAU_G00189990 [Synaphobranchus kaupii]|uniref:Uncharacterized protein n=1 Tax=Synaphobranchus kaupii TaxID=118154 RepID=A0A9Q1FD94_SYNKA|nr:hypothetical protein SKAU_G00189990 [Synaphobranchus kaupii]